MYQQNQNDYRLGSHASSVVFNAVRLPRFVMCQNVALRLLIQHVDIVVGQIDNPGPQTSGINHHRGGRSFRAARDQHRYQACD